MSVRDVRVVALRMHSAKCWLSAAATSHVEYRPLLCIATETLSVASFEIQEVSELVKLAEGEHKEEKCFVVSSPSASSGGRVTRKSTFTEMLPLAAASPGL